MTLALPSAACNADSGRHSLTDLNPSSAGPSSCSASSSLQLSAGGRYERDAISQPLKSTCSPSSATNNIAPTPSSEPRLQSIKTAPPPSLHRHSGLLRLKLQSGDNDIPPAFYAGAMIPFELGLELPHPRRAGSLKLSLIGTLRTPHTTRHVVNIATDLPCSDWTWARGAGEDDTCAPSEVPTETKNGTYIPGGRWRQSVCVQLPRQAVLPPSVSALWELSYRFRLIMCPVGYTWDPLATGCLIAEQPIDILPTTLPTPAPLLVPYSFWLPRLGSSATERWVARLSLPTTAFGPTSVIPVSLELACPAAAGQQAVAVTLSLVREEMVTARIGPGSSSQSNATTLATTRGYIHAPGAWVESRLRLELDLRGIRGIQPTASIKVVPASVFEDDDECLWTSVSSNAGLKVKCGYKLWLWLEFSTGTKCITVPVTLGSVGEPRDAMRQYEWSELYFPPPPPNSVRTSPSSRDRARTGAARGEHEGEREEPNPMLICGTEEGAEDGWLVPPPSYREALDVVPYVYDTTV